MAAASEPKFPLSKVPASAVRLSVTYENDIVKYLQQARGDPWIRVVPRWDDIHGWPTYDLGPAAEDRAPPGGTNIGHVDGQLLQYALWWDKTAVKWKEQLVKQAGGHDKVVGRTTLHCIGSKIQGVENVVQYNDAFHMWKHLNEQLDKAIADRDAAKAISSTGASDLVAKNAEIAQLKRDYESAKKDADRVPELERAKARAEAKADSYHDKLEDAHKQLAKALDAGDRVRSERDDYKQKWHSAQQELDKMSQSGGATSGATQEKLEAKQKELDAAKTELANREEELKKCRAHESRLSDTVTKLQQENTQLRLSASKDELDRIKAENSRLNDRLERLKADLVKAKAQTATGVRDGWPLTGDPRHSDQRLLFAVAYNDQLRGKYRVLASDLPERCHSDNYVIMDIRTNGELSVTLSWRESDSTGATQVNTGTWKYPIHKRMQPSDFVSLAQTVLGSKFTIQHIEVLYDRPWTVHE